MTLRLSKRISIQWGDDAPSEPTDTVVLSVGSYFMDLRISKVDKTIDWAFAGVRETISQAPLHCRWYHSIDSRLSFDPDEGKFQSLPNGDDLETGSMPCPDRDNQVTPYTEVWRQLPPKPGMEHGWILERRWDEGTRFLGQFGGIYYAMQQNKDGHFSVRKEEWVEVEGQPRWKLTYQAGNTELPSLEKNGMVRFDGEEQWEVGKATMVEGEPYDLRALHSVSQEDIRRPRQNSRL